MSGNRLADALAVGALDGVPDLVNNPALFRSLQRKQGDNVAWLLSMHRKFVGGGSGIKCTTPGAVARIDHIGPTTINGHVINALVIVDEATSLMLVYLLSRKRNTAAAVILYQRGICKPNGRELKALRSDPDSTIGIDWLSKINEEVNQGMNILEPLSRTAVSDNRRSSGISVTKTATEQHEPMVERYIQSVKNDAINAMISQNNLPAEYWGYALMNAAERMNAMVGNNDKTRYEDFYGQRPHWVQVTSMPFGGLGVTRRPQQAQFKGILPRNEFVAVLVSPNGLVGQHLVLRAHDSNNIPVMRGDIIPVLPGALERTAAEWKSLEPTIDDNGKIISVKSGTRELFSVERAVHQFQQRQLQPATAGQLTDSQMQRWEQLSGTKPQQRTTNATNQHPVVPLPIPIHPPTSNLPSTSSPNLSPSRHLHIDESEHSVEAGEEHGRTQSAGEFLPNRMSNHPPLDLVVHPHPQIQSSSSTNRNLDLPSLSNTSVNEDGWITDHREVNGRVAAMFDGKVYGGTIDRMLPAHIDSEGDEIDDVYHVKYDDGDEEEMEGSKALQHAKDMVKYLPTQHDPTRLQHIPSPHVMNDSIRKSQRLAQRTLHARSMRLTPQQIMLLVTDEMEAPTTSKSFPLLLPVQPLTSADEFMCIPNLYHDEAGNMRPSTSNPTYQPPTYPLPASPTPTTMTNNTGESAYLTRVLGAPCDAEDYSRLLREIDNDYQAAPPQYDEHVLEAASLWEFLYHQWPTSEEFDFLEHVCTIFGRAPSPLEL